MSRRFKVTREVVGYKGFLGLKRLHLRHSLFAGGESRELVRERIEAFEAASVLLHDPRSDKLVLIEQFRVGAMEDPRGPWLLEVVGGIVEAGETPEDVARREAMEEAGCRVSRIEPIATLWVSPGFSTERLHLFYGEVDASGAGGIHGLQEEGEDIRVVVLDVDEVLAQLHSGRFRATSILVSLQWLALNRGRLRWGSDLQTS